ncbi:MAG: hypothetical protein SPI77_02945 [Corynebacterium sp.]|nr:hypothetical protein [Corynebacterium sp.]
MAVTDMSDYSRWNTPVIRHKGIASFMALPRVESGLHTITLGRSHLDIFYRRRSSPVTLIVFAAATDRDDAHRPPFFSGMALAENLPCSFISVSDPAFTVDPTLRIGWYLGADNEPIQQELGPILDKLIGQGPGAEHCLLSGTNRAVLLGGSAGGFAALWFGAQLNHPAHVIAMNPQTDMTKYMTLFVAHAARVSCGWDPGPLKTTTEIDKAGAEGATLLHERFTVDLIEYYRALAHQPRITYFQNSTDLHLHTHAEPFLQVTHDAQAIIKDWGEGHIPPPKDELLTYLLPATAPYRWMERIVQKIPPAKIQEIVAALRRLQ